MQSKRCFAVLVGRKDLAGAEVIFKFHRLARARDGDDAPDLMARDVLDDSSAGLREGIMAVEAQGATRVLLPDLLAQARLAPTMPASVVDLIDALRAHLDRYTAGHCRLGVLSDDPAVRDYLAARLDRDGARVGRGAETRHVGSVTVPDTPFRLCEIGARRLGDAAGSARRASMGERLIMQRAA